MKIPIYPDDFFDFSDGVDVDNKEINRWIKECIVHIEKENTNYCSIGSGNTKIIVSKIIENDDDKYNYRINVIKKYSEAETGENN